MSELKTIQSLIRVHYIKCVYWPIITFVHLQLGGAPEIEENCDRSKRSFKFGPRHVPIPLMLPMCYLNEDWLSMEAFSPSLKDHLGVCNWDQSYSEDKVRSVPIMVLFGGGGGTQINRAKHLVSCVLWSKSKRCTVISVRRKKASCHWNNFKYFSQLCQFV